MHVVFNSKYIQNINRQVNDLNSNSYTSDFTKALDITICRPVESGYITCVMHLTTHLQTVRHCQTIAARVDLFLSRGVTMDDCMLRIIMIYTPYRARIRV